MITSPLVRFILLGGTIYLIGIGLFNIAPVEGVFNAVVHRISDATLSTLLPDAEIEVVTGEDEEKRLNPNVMQVNFTLTPEHVRLLTQEAVRNNQNKLAIPHRYTKYYIYQFFTIPIILFISLFLATPMSIPQRLRSILYGGVPLLVFLWMKLVLLVLFSISNTRIGIYELSASTMEILLKAASVMTLGVSVILVIVLWGVIALPKSGLIDAFQILIQGEDVSSSD